MNITLSSEHRAIVTATFREIIPISDTFVHMFYNRLFELKPTVKPLFNSSIDDQGPKLIAMLVILVKSLDRLDDLVPAIQALSKRHVKYGVVQEDYPVVGEALLWALEYMLKERFTSDVKMAWAAMYTALADICIEAGYR